MTTIYEIKGFPNYILDTSSQQLLGRGLRPLKKRRKHGRETNVFRLKRNGQELEYSYERLFFCIMYGISPSDIPIGYYVLPSGDGSVRLMDASEKGTYSASFCERMKRNDKDEMIAYYKRVAEFSEKACTYIQAKFGFTDYEAEEIWAVAREKLVNMIVCKHTPVIIGWRYILKCLCGLARKELRRHNRFTQFTTANKSAQLQLF